MADQTYNLTQTGAEVQAIINDANGVKGAGATTSLTTDYIMLKDTSGAYHKIQKSSFTEAVRNTLASLLVNNDKGTTISQIAAIASGDFGSVTPANLASVLGGLQTHINANSNLNDYVNCGVYQVDNSSDAQSITNSPYSNSGYSLIVIPSGNNRIQIIIANNGQAWYSRGKVSNEWKSWYKLEGTVIE